MENISKKRLLLSLKILFISVLLAIIYVILFVKFGIVIPCFFHEITHLYCPGCGITRMIVSLLRIDFYQAFRFNPLLFIFLPFTIFLVVDAFIKWLKGSDTYFYKKISNKVWIILIIVTIGFGIIRNIPYFDYLIPTVVR